GELRDHGALNRVSPAARDAGDLVDRRLARLGEAEERPTAAANTADGGGGAPDGQMEIRDRLCDERTHPNHRKTADDQIAADDAARSDGGAFPPVRGLGMLGRLRRPE